MMKTSIQLSNFPGLRRNPGLAEINGLLDRLPMAALLVDVKSKHILLANAKSTELTLYTRQALTDMDISVLFLEFDEETHWGTSKNESYPETLTISRKNKPELQVLANRYNLSPQDKWSLITLEPVSVLHQREAERQRRSELLESMKTISLALHETELKPALELFLRAAQKMTAASNLSIYLPNLASNNQEFEVGRFTNIGPPDNLPEHLPALELAQLRTANFWSAGKRVPTSLQRSARSAGLTYVATAPLGQPNALIGLVVIAGNQTPPMEQVLGRLQVLAEAITALVEQHTRQSNLARDLKNRVWENTIHHTIENFVFDGVIVLNPDLTISRLNNSAVAILGYNNHEAQGHTVEDILIGTETLLPALNAALQGDPTLKQANVRLYRRSGQAFLAQVSTVPTIVDDKLFGIVILIQDLSIQEQFQIQTQELERQALLGEVIAIFAHEVRNPINNISTGLQLMAYNHAEDDPNQEVIGRLQQDCDRLSVLMNSVLAFSRPAEYKMETLDLSPLIKRLVDRARPRMAKTNVEPHLQIESSLPPISGDLRALEQVFTNLINNAIQAMGEAGGTLAIKIQNLLTSGESPYLQVDIADNGPGIPKENLDRIFQPFFTTKSDGTGLGLAITKRIVTAHKGNIQVTSFPGGTVFHVQLPVLEVL